MAFEGALGDLDRSASPIYDAIGPAATIAAISLSSIKINLPPDRPPSLFRLVNQEIREKLVDSIQNKLARSKAGRACGFIDLWSVPYPTHTSTYSHLSDFCKCIRWSDLGARLCLQCDLANAVMSYHRKSPTVYTCHAGLIDYQLPLIHRDGRVVGTFVGGQLASSHLDFLHIARLGEALRIARPEWPGAAGCLPVLTRQVADAICDELTEALKSQELEGLDYNALESQVERLRDHLKLQAEPDFGLYNLSIRKWLCWHPVYVQKAVPVDMRRSVILVNTARQNEQEERGNGNGVRAGWFHKTIGGFDESASLMDVGRTMLADLIGEWKQVGQKDGRPEKVVLAGQRSTLMDDQEIYYPSRATGELRYLRAWIGNGSPRGVYHLGHFLEDRDEDLCACVSEAIAKLEATVDFSNARMGERWGIPVSGNDVRDEVRRACMAVTGATDVDTKRIHVEALVERMIMLESAPPADIEYEDQTNEVVVAFRMLAGELRNALRSARCDSRRLDTLACALRRSSETLNWPRIDSHVGRKRALDAFYWSLVADTDDDGGGTHAQNGTGCHPIGRRGRTNGKRRPT